MSKIQSEIENEGSKDKGLKALEVELNANSLKRQIPSDHEITSLKELEDVIKVNTIPNVFVNYNLNFTPKTAEAETGKNVKETEVKKEPEEKPTPKITYVKNKKELKDLLQKLFKLTDEQAEAVATIFELNSKAWAARTKNKPSDFYKTLGFSDMLESINNSLLQAKTDVEKVISGFKLRPIYKDKIFVGFASQERGLAGIKLKDGINKWTKDTGIKVEAYIPYSGGNVFLRKTDGVLKQASGLEYNFQFENETEQIYDVVKDGVSVGVGSIEKMEGNKAKVSFFKNTSDIKGTGLQIFKDLTSKIVQEGYTPVIDQYITGYGFKAYEKLAEEGYLVKNNVAQINPEDSPTKQQDYGENLPFSYSEKTIKENDENIKKYLQDNNFIEYICK